MMDWLKQHISIVVIIVIAITLLLPLGINAAYLVETDCCILHKPSEWTTFWGSYLGPIISAGVAFIILAIQYNQNKKENQANRNLQLSVLSYQSEKEFLENFISVSAKLISSINPIEVKLVCNMAGISTSDYVSKIKNISTSINNCYQEFCLWLNDEDDKMTKEIATDVRKLVENYLAAIYDIQNIALMLLEDNALTVSRLYNDNYQMSFLSTSMSQVIEEYINTGDEWNSITDIRIVMIKRLDKVSESQVELHGIIEPYIREEEKRIKGLLISNNN